MNSRTTAHMQKLSLVLISMVAILAFQNCRIEIVSSPMEPIGPTPQGGNLSKIEYHYNAGFAPVPSSTDLTMTRLNDGSILADLRTENCITQTPISPNDFAKLESQIENSPRRYLNPQVMIADASSSYVVTSRKSGSQTISEIQHLTELGVTGWYLEDGLRIEQSLKVIIEGIKGLKCSPSVGTTASIRFQKSERISFVPATGGTAPASLQAVDVDLVVKFFQGVAYLSGHISTTSQPNQKVPDCQTVYSDSPIRLPASALQKSADSIRYSRGNPVCAMAEYLGPVQTVIGPTLTSQYLNGNMVSGQIGCLYSNVALNSGDFLVLLDQHLQTTDKCATNPLGVRLTAIPVSTN